MAISTRIPSTLDSNKFVPEIFSRQVLVAVKSMLVALPFIDSLFDSRYALNDNFEFVGFGINIKYQFAK